MEINKRKSNIELLRIVAMLMIVADHLAVHGVCANLLVESAKSTMGVNSVYMQGTFINRLFTSFMSGGGMIGAAIFFMITGYFQIYRKKYKLRKVVMQCFVYSVASLILFILLKLVNINIPTIKLLSVFLYSFKAIFNPSTSVWWFASAYVFLMILSPLINTFFLNLNKNGRLMIIIIFWLLWYSVGMNMDATYASIERAVFFYLIGAYIHVERPITEKKRIYINAVIAIIFWIIATYCLFVSLNTSTDATIKYKLLSKFYSIIFVSICVPICAYNIFRFFEKSEIESNQLINMISSTTFGIYLIHDNYIVRPLIWHSILKVQTFQYQLDIFPLTAIISTFIVFLSCSIIDLFRQRTIEPVCLKICDRVVNLFLKKYAKSE